MRSRRVDAVANRERILDVAEDVFGRGGAAASTEEVARRAGVGIATVFRHFPTKAALLEAVLVRRFDRLRDEAAALAEASDIGAAFFGLFRHLVADAPAKLAIGDALVATSASEDAEVVRASNGLRRAVGELLRRAQAAGAVRDDVELPEVYALLIAMSRAQAAAGFDDEVLDRALAVVFDGLAGERLDGIEVGRGQATPRVGTDQ